MKFQLPDLPFAKDALLPHMSPQTLSYHHDKHHRSYVDKLNTALENADYDATELPDLILEARARGDEGVFNNAAQAWNHAFFWDSLDPAGRDRESTVHAKLVDRFGGADAVRERFVEVGTGRFGSGWVWVVFDADGEPDIVSTPNAEPPQVHGLVPLLTCDVWEHAYYLDYQNARGEFLEAFFDSLANWAFADENARRAEDMPVMHPVGGFAADAGEAGQTAYRH